MTTMRIPGEFHAILADRLERLVRDLMQTPEWARDSRARDEEIVLTVERRKRVARKAS